MNASPSLPTARPVGLLAELTHRCPLGCPYCSNPIDLDARTGELPTEVWARVFAEAGALGIHQVHLSGGEPASRRDLVELVAHCAAAGLYSNLITSGIGLTPALIGRLCAAGLDHVQLSIQDTDDATADTIAGYAGAAARKRAVAAEVVGAGLPLTVNAVIHRANLAHADALIDYAVALGARRVEIAHAQYYGWGARNRAALMPEREQALAAVAAVERAKAARADVIVVDHVLPDFHALYPKACMGGWGRRTMNVTPMGIVLPCHAAQTIPNLTFWSVRDHGLAEIWEASPAFAAFQGTDWMREPCRSCARQAIDFGGCRCQALALTGDARNTDPVCHLSPHHDLVDEAVALDTASSGPPPAYAYRRQPEPAR